MGRKGLIAVLVATVVAAFVVAPREAAAWRTRTFVGISVGAHFAPVFAYPYYVPAPVYVPPPAVAVPWPTYYYAPSPVWVPGGWQWNGFVWVWVNGYWRY